ncbi:hypothetical protein M0R45_001026 [Rubus argutus]|uniref:Uncharacterized protein n=1 Tax=Rubus argutus TaxID=59490 RepID=A0AAW1VIT6_RUBAR
MFLEINQAPLESEDRLVMLLQNMVWVARVSTNGDVYSFGILLLELFTGKRPTDQMFSGGLNLHNYAKAVLPDHVTKIADSLVLQGGITDIDEALDQGGARAKKMEECLTVLFGIGIACSAEFPTNRKNISDVVSELYSIRNDLLG